MNRSGFAIFVLALLVAGSCHAHQLDFADQRDDIATSLGSASGWQRSLFLQPRSTDDVAAARSVEFFNAGEQLDTGVTWSRDVDSYGFRRYTVLFSALTYRSTAVQFRARIRKADKRIGVPSDRALALGFAVPWRQFGFELEGIDDRSFGRALLGTIRWSDADDRFGCALTVPLAAPRGLAGAVIVQLVYHFPTPPVPLRTGWF